MHCDRPAIAVIAAVATLAAGPSQGAAVAPPPSDLAYDAVGDVVRTYADSSTVTGHARSDIRSVSLARTASPGGSGPRQTAATASVRLAEVDRRLQEHEVRLVVRWVTDNGRRATTTTYFGGRLGGRTYVDGLPAADCVPYPDLDSRLDTLSIALANDSQCWPGASAIRARAWVRYRFSESGVARDASPWVGPVTVPEPVS